MLYPWPASNVIYLAYNEFFCIAFDAYTYHAPMTSDLIFPQLPPIQLHVTTNRHYTLPTPWWEIDIWSHRHLDTFHTKKLLPPPDNWITAKLRKYAMHSSVVYFLVFIVHPKFCPGSVMAVTDKLAETVVPTFAVIVGTGGYAQLLCTLKELPPLPA